MLNAIGFTVITGEIGSGKTTLLRCLLAHMDQTTVVGLLNSTKFEEPELLQWVMMAFGQKFENLSNVALFRDFHISSLSREEVEHYIEHRTQTAGAPHSLFTPEAAAMIAHASRGIPRLINLLCDTALVYGYASQAKVINYEIVEQVIAERSNYFTLGNERENLALDRLGKN